MATELKLRLNLRLTRRAIQLLSVSPLHPEPNDLRWDITASLLLLSHFLKSWGGTSPQVCFISNDVQRTWSGTSLQVTLCLAVDQVPSLAVEHHFKYLSALLDGRILHWFSPTLPLLVGALLPSRLPAVAFVLTSQHAQLVTVNVHVH